MSWQKRKQQAESRAKILTDMQALLEKADTEKRSLTTEEDAQFNDMNKRAEEIGQQIERYDKVLALAASGKPTGQEKRSTQPGHDDIDPGREENDERAKETRTQFNTYLRSGELGPIETRAVTVSGAGVVGIREFSSTLVDKLKTFVGVRQAGAEVISTSNGNEMGIPTGDDTSNTGELLGENVESSETDVSPTIGNASLKGYKFYSKPIPVSIEMLQDAAFDVEAYIIAKAAERIGRVFNTYTTTGTGSSQPQGVVYAATSGKVAVEPDAIEYDELLDLVHSIDPAYRQSPTFGLMLHDTTLAAARKMKDGNGAYIWTAGAAGAPTTLLGYRYTINNAMATLASGVSSRVVTAGDFSRYVIRDVGSPLVIRDPYTQAKKGMVLFHVYSRHDGRLTDTTAVKYLATAAE